MNTPTFNILAYGALPGSDCSAAFQSAIDATFRVGGTVLIPCGVWTIRTTLYIPLSRWRRIIRAFGWCLKSILAYFMSLSGVYLDKEHP